MKRNGFTLIELSIVLVISGLLVGSVLAGQALIKAAEIRSIVTDKDKFVVAIKTFRLKYDWLPGDMPNAGNYWGLVNADPATCQATVGTGTQTCNGNGDSHIGTFATSAATNYEMYRAWQHLANAGLIEGQYSGVIGPASVYQAVIGTNVPRSKVNNAGFSILYTGPLNDVNWFETDYKHIIHFGTADPTLWTLDGAITTTEAYSIDQKIDDGKPSTGMVMTFRAGSSYAGSCATTAVLSTAAYAVTTNGIQCHLIFKLGF